MYVWGSSSMVRISMCVARMKWLLSICCCVMPRTHTLFTTYQAYQTYEQGNVQKAVELFGSCVAQNPHDWYSLYNLGTIALNQEHYTEAIKHFEKALELQPEHDSTRERLAYARRREQERQKQEEQQQQKKSESEQQSSPQTSSDESSPNQHDSQSQSQDKRNNSPSNDDQQKDQPQPQDAGQQQSPSSQQQQPENAASPQHNTAHNAENERGAQQQQNSAAPASGQQGNDSATADLLEQQLSKSEQQLLYATDEIDREAQKQLLYRTLVQDHKESNAKTARHNW